MPNELHTQSALEWAVTVAPRHYAKHRAELDSLVLATVPSYERSVAARLDALSSGVDSSREASDREHAAAQFTRPWRVRWLRKALFWTYLLGILISFGLMVPAGGRSVGAADFSLIDWGLFVALSAISFVIGVLAQLALRFPVVPGMPPRRDLAWLAPAFGALTVAVMIVNYIVEENVQLGWVVLTAVALLASFVYCLTRLVQRRRDPALTKLVDTSEQTRIRAARDSLIARADSCADAIEHDFDALSPSERARLLTELDAATEELRRRGFIRAISQQEKKDVARRQHVRKRPMVPGFLLLERRVQQLWTHGSEFPITWHAYQYLPLKKR